MSFQGKSLDIFAVNSFGSGFQVILIVCIELSVELCHHNSCDGNYQEKTVYGVESHSLI